MKIPRGTFGNETAPPVPIQPASARQLDGGLGQAFSNLGAAGTNLAETITHTNEVARREAEHEAKVQKASRDAADKATAAAKLGYARDSLDDLHANFADGILTGQIDKTKAGDLWKKQSSDLVQKAMGDIPESQRDVVQNDLNIRAGRLENKVARDVLIRDRTDTLAGIDQTLSYASRLSTTDPVKGRQMGIDVLDQLGPFAGLNADEVTKKKQAFIEGVSYTRAYSAVTTLRGDNSQLRAVDKIIAADPDMKPLDKAHLLTTSSGFQSANDQRAEMAAQRAQRVAEANLRRAEAAFNTFQALSDKGGMIDPVEVERVSKLTAGTPYQAGVKQLAQQAVETGGIAAQPINVQRATLDAIDRQINTTGRSAALDKRRDQIERVLKASEEDLKKDAMQAGVDRGVIKKSSLEDIDMSNAATLQASFEKRLVQAQMVSEWAGRPVSLLRASEKRIFTDMLVKMPTAAKESMLGTLRETLGPMMVPVLRDISKEAPRLAVAAGLVGMKTASGRSVTRLVLEGDDLLRGKQFQLPADPKMLEAFTKQVGEALPTIEAKQAAMSAAEAVYARLMTDKGLAVSKDVSMPEWRAAVSLLTGGIIEHNGRKILPVQYGVPKSETLNLLRSVNAAQVKAWGGVAGMTDEQAAEYIAGAPLESISVGRYRVLAGASILQRADGQPFEMRFTPGGVAP